MNRKIAITASIILVAAIAGYWLFPKPESSKTPEVPLGVEHAVTITYSGSELMVQPYRFGVPVNLRIAKVTEVDGARIYDIRYMLNTGGEFDVTDYLSTTDGSPLDDLPEFKVFGLEHLSQNMDQRIEQVEEMGIDISHHYYEWMGAVIALWVVWLLLLIFWGREKPELAEEAVPMVTFYDVLQSFLNQIENNAIDDKGKAQLEMLMINWWRDQLGCTDLEMHEAMRRIGQDPTSAPAFSNMQQWLHNPKNTVSMEEVVASLRPFSVLPETPAP